MIWHIAKKEFHQNLITLRFITGTLICVTFTIAIQIVHLDEYRTRVKAYNRTVSENETRLRGFHVYSEITSDVVKPPEILSMFSEGLEKELGNVISVRRQEVPHQASHVILDNPFLKLFKTIDTALIFKLVLSLMALLFSFDMFSGEKERGTLKLCLSNASRIDLFAGKYLGGLGCLVLPLLFSFILGMLIQLFAPYNQFSFSTVLRIFLFFGVSLIFMAAFFTIGALVSSMTYRSVTSLALSLFIWVCLIVAIPNLGDYIAAQLKTVDSVKSIEAKVDVLRNELRQKEREFSNQHYPKSNTVINGSSERFSIGTKTMVDYMLMYIPFVEPLRREYANRMDAVRRDYFSQLLLQSRFVNRFTLFSPVRLYETTASILCRTDVETHLDYIDQARLYRDQILTYYQDKNAYQQLRFFTIMEPEEVPDLKFDNFWREFVEQPGEVKRQWDALAERVTWETRPPLNLDDFPRFRYRSIRIDQSLIRTLPYSAILICLILILMLIAYFRFIHYDVR